MTYNAENLERQFKNLGGSRRGRKKYANVVIGDAEKGILGYGNHATVLSVYHLPNWWMDTGTDIHV